MTKKRFAILILIILTIVFIYGQSMVDQVASMKNSTAVKKQVVEPVYKAVTGHDAIRFDVRDLAHVVEFALLGIELVLFVNIKRPI